MSSASQRTNPADDGEEVHGYRWLKIIAAVEVAALSCAVTYIGNNITPWPRRSLRRFLRTDQIRTCSSKKYVRIASSWLLTEKLEELIDSLATACLLDRNHHITTINAHNSAIGVPKCFCFSMAHQQPFQVQFKIAVWPDKFVCAVVYGRSSLPLPTWRPCMLSSY